MLGCIRSSFSIFFLKSSFAPSVHFFSSPRLIRSLISRSFGSPPNSSRMDFICCCRKYSLCCLSISARVLLVISFFNSTNCNSACNNWSNFSARRCILSSSSNACLSASLEEIFEAIKCMRNDCCSILRSTIEASDGILGDNCAIRSESSFIDDISASKEASCCGYISSRYFTLAAKYGSVCVKLSTLNRILPMINMVIFPSGIFICFTTLANVPT